MKNKLSFFMMSILVLVAMTGNSHEIATNPQPIYGGQATVIKASLLGLPLIISNAGPLPAQGGALEVSLLDLSNPLNGLGLLSADVLHATTIGQGNHSESEAIVTNLSLNLGTISVGAEVLMARASATCSGLSGGSDIAVLTINQTPIVVTGQPNQTIDLGLARVIINEQVKTPALNPSSITVNALHIIVAGIADITISSASASMKCPVAPPCQGGDFVTGGGTLDLSTLALTSSNKASFAVAGGYKNNRPWGHLNFKDPRSGIRVKGTEVTSYTVISTTTRRIQGRCEVNGSRGFTYTATVSDNGEPGTKDTFRLQLSNNYDTKTNKLSGGNIQLHKPCKR